MYVFFVLGPSINKLSKIWKSLTENNILGIPSYLTTPDMFEGLQSQIRPIYIHFEESYKIIEACVFTK